MEGTIYSEMLYKLVRMAFSLQEGKSERFQMWDGRIVTCLRCSDDAQADIVIADTTVDDSVLLPFVEGLLNGNSFIIELAVEGGSRKFEWSIA